MSNKDEVYKTKLEQLDRRIAEVAKQAEILENSIAECKDLADRLNGEFSAITSLKRDVLELMRKAHEHKTIL